MAAPTGENRDHPIFSNAARRHFDEKRSAENDWKPSVKSFPGKDATRPEKQQGVKNVKIEFTQAKAG